METMIELTVLFENPTIPNKVLLTGPFEGDLLSNLDGAIGQAMHELRAQAEEELKAQLKDEQCFYRFFQR